MEIFCCSTPATRRLHHILCCVLDLSPVWAYGARGMCLWLFGPFIENVETLISAWVQLLNAQTKIWSYKHGGKWGKNSRRRRKRRDDLWCDCSTSDLVELNLIYFLSLFITEMMNRDFSTKCSDNIFVEWCVKSSDVLVELLGWLILKIPYSANSMCL